MKRIENLKGEKRFEKPLGFFSDAETFEMSTFSLCHTCQKTHFLPFGDSVFQFEGIFQLIRGSQKI